MAKSLKKTWKKIKSTKAKTILKKAVKYERENALGQLEAANEALKPFRPEAKKIKSYNPPPVRLMAKKRV